MEGPFKLPDRINIGREDDPTRFRFERELESPDLKNSGMTIEEACALLAVRYKLSYLTEFVHTLWQVSPKH